MIAHEFGAAGDKPVLWTAQPHIIMLPDVVVQADVVCVPVFAERANIHGLELVLPIGAVMGAPGEHPLGVQTPQPHETGAPKPSASSSRTTAPLGHLYTNMTLSIAVLARSGNQPVVVRGKGVFQPSL